MVHDLVRKKFKVDVQRNGGRRRKYEKRKKEFVKLIGVVNLNKICDAINSGQVGTKSGRDRITHAA